jgi:hypothetical protein
MYDFQHCVICRPSHSTVSENAGIEPRAGIFKKSMGARHGVRIGLLYRPAKLHRLAEFIPWNQFRGPIHVQKYQLRTVATLALKARRSNHSARTHIISPILIVPRNFFCLFVLAQLVCYYCIFVTHLPHHACYGAGIFLWISFW